MRVIAAAELRDWIPIRVYSNDGSALVDWCYMGDDRFTDPFFSDTIRQRMRHPFNALFRHQTRLESLADMACNVDFVAPTGFIFHMSRCGSTLVAQMLAALKANIVISEAPPIDAIVRSHHDADERGRWLRSMVHVMGRRRYPEERNYFIKFDSWNALHLSFIREVFPDVPWIFLYRNPVEVIVSQMRQRGSQMVPGALNDLMPDLSLTEALQMPAEEHCAKILARFCAAALEHAADEEGLLINYEQLPGALTGAIASHFGTPFTAEEVGKMKTAAQFNAKTPQMFFEPDGVRKRGEATDAARKAAEMWVDPLYERLENLRTSFSI